VAAQDYREALEQETARLECIHCGLCLSACPTYLQLGNEVDSPRGRIYLINAVTEGRIEPTSTSFEKHMHQCLECRACESACPSGVQFALMMNEARALIRSNKKPARWESLLRRLVFLDLLPHRRRLRLLFNLLRLYQKTGIQKLLRRSGLFRILPAKLGVMESLLPRVGARAPYSLPRTAAGNGSKSVSLFEGCVMPELFGAANQATVNVLEKNGVQVCSPPEQTCCGALHLHDGEIELARDLARRNIEAFERDGADCIVVNAAGCGAMLKEYGQLLREDREYAARARVFSGRVKDIAEFLDGMELNKNLSPLHMKVTYDDPCHLRHGQGIKDAPRNLLKSIPGIEWAELPEADRCCGSAGIYNITHPEISARVLDEKIDHILETGAEVVASGNPGCLLQIGQGLRARNAGIETVHPVELLDRAYREYEKKAAGKND
jgi:glycolate oxidase iron-sulfur subunit